MARLTSLLKQTFRNASGEGPSNQLVIFVQAPIMAQLEERMGEHGQELLHNPVFVRLYNTPVRVSSDQNIRW
jgi:hypothetical protein